MPGTFNIPNDLTLEKRARIGDSVLSAIAQQSGQLWADGSYIPPQDNLIEWKSDAMAVAVAAAANDTNNIRLSVDVNPARAERLLYVKIARISEIMPAANPIADDGMSGVLTFKTADGSVIGTLPLDRNGRKNNVRLVGAPGPSTYSVSLTSNSGNTYNTNQNLNAVDGGDGLIMVSILQTGGTGDYFVMPPTLRLLMACARIEMTFDKVHTEGTTTGGEIMTFFLGCLSRTPLNGRVV